jgi:hypothetical protein
MDSEQELGLKKGWQLHPCVATTERFVTGFFGSDEDTSAK